MNTQLQRAERLAFQFSPELSEADWFLAVDYFRQLAYKKRSLSKAQLKRLIEIECIVLHPDSKCTDTVSELFNSQ